MDRASKVTLYTYFKVVWGKHSQNAHAHVVIFLLLCIRTLPPAVARARALGARLARDEARAADDA
eukprot:scaffold18729_cov66-Phaeocystis_antarctica.AAC.6